MEKLQLGWDNSYRNVIKKVTEGAGHMFFTRMHRSTKLEGHGRIEENASYQKEIWTVGSKYIIIIFYKKQQIANILL